MKIKFLGYNADTAVSVMEWLNETGQEPPYEVFLNLDREFEAYMPNLYFPHSFKYDFADEEGATYFFGTAGPKNKKAIYEFYWQNHQVGTERYAILRHPTAYIAKSSVIGKGALIGAGTWVNAQSNIGFGVNIKLACTISHHVKIGAYSDINPGVILSGRSEIGKECSIGAGVVVRDKVKIGDNTVIGMGSVVVSDIPAKCVAYGNPCKVVRSLPS